MRHAILAGLAGAALLAAGCGDGDSGGTSSPAAPAAAGSTTATIRIEDFDYVPSPATVKAGQRIAVVNGDQAPHTLTEQPASGDPLFGTGTLKGDARGSFTAARPGTYAVYCVIHPFMKGEVKVVE